MGHLVVALLLSQALQPGPESAVQAGPVGAWSIGPGSRPSLWLPLTVSGPGSWDDGPGHNLLLRTTLEGGGSTPTGWGGGTTGTSDPVASAYGSDAVAYTQTSAGVDRPYFTQSFTAAASTVYYLSVLVEANPNGIVAQQIVGYQAGPAGSVVTYFPSAVYVPAAGETVTAILTIAGTAGTPAVRVGLGTSSAVSGSVTFSRPALENRPRGLWVPTTTVADTSYTVSNVSFDGRHNLILQSEDLSTTWLSSGASVTTNQGPAGYTDLDLVSNTAGSFGDARYQTMTVPSSTGPWTVFGTFASGTGSLRLQASSLTGCVCSRSDGGACVATNGTVGSATGTFTTPAVMSLTCSDATLRTTVIGAISPGNYAASQTGAVLFGRAQFNIGGATTYVPTTTAARTSVPLDALGLAWTENGATPAVQSSGLPATAASGAAGPFTDAAYFSSGTGADALDSTGDRWGCVSFVPTSFAAFAALYQNGSSPTAGHLIDIAATTGTFQFRSYTPAQVFVDAGGAAVLNALNVACWWRTGTTIAAKLNLGSTGTSAAAGTEVAGTAYVAKIGRGEPATQPFTGKILHVLQGLGPCPVPPAPFAASCEGWATYQMKRQFGMLGTRGEEINLTRASPATLDLNGAIWNVPAGVPRVSTQGMLVEGASAPGITNQSASCVGTAVNAPWTLAGTPTCVADAFTAPNGDGMDEWTSVGSSDRVLQTATITSSATFTASVWAQKPATGYATVIGRCTGGTANACACGSSDGAACTPLASTSDCTAFFPSVSATPVRIWASATCAAALTNPSVLLSPGQQGVATGTTRFGMIQVEPGLSPTSYMTAARSADVPSLAWPTLPTNDRWCVETTATPYQGAWTRASIGYVAAIGSGAGSSTWRMTNNADGSVSFVATDSDGTGGSAAASTALSPGAHRLSGIIGALTTPDLKVDRSTAVGPRTGDITSGFGAFGAMYLGTRSAAAFEFDGYLRDFKIYRDARCGR